MKFVIIGAGGMGGRWSEAVARSPGAELGGVVDLLVGTDRAADWIAGTGAPAVTALAVTARPRASELAAAARRDDDSFMGFSLNWQGCRRTVLRHVMALHICYRRSKRSPVRWVGG